MADEQKTDDRTDDDKSGKVVFDSQEDFDAVIKRRLDKERDKYRDYDTVKSELEDLRQKQKEREDAELSELDKLKKQNEETTGKLTEYEQKLKDYEEAEEKRKAALLEKVEDQMKDLDDGQKTLVDQMPLDGKLDLIAQLKSQKKEAGSWGKGSSGDELSLEYIQELKEKFGAASPQFREAYGKYRMMRGL